MWHINSPRDFVRNVESGKIPKDSLKTFQSQKDLPPLPVPPLAKTLSKYLSSVEPAVSKEEFVRTKQIVEEFQKGKGPILQQQLEQLAKLKEKEGKSWLEEWWLLLAYHAWQDPIILTSNWYTTLCDHPLSTSIDINQITRATSLTIGFLVYRDLLERGLLPPDMNRKQPICMDQSTRIFSTARIPGTAQDHLVTFPPAQSRHIIVLRKDQIYSFDVLDAEGKIIPHAEIQAQFRFVWEISEVFSEQPPIGLFTAERRDIWANMRSLMSQSEKNKRSLEIIDSALFAVCLDDISPNTRHEIAQRSFHNYTGRNRWFDKSFNLIVFQNGKAGLNAEHSPLDAPPLAHGALTFAVFYEAADPYLELNAKLRNPRSQKLKNPVQLEWELLPEVKVGLHQAAKNVQAFISSFETECLEFEEYGSDFLKQVKISPDAFIQMVIQLAYYKISKKVTATYETAQTRKFFHGRTETVRTLSNASKAFVIGMEDPQVPNEEKFKLLQKAIASHLEYMNDASNGEGVDRHLLGLMMCAKGAGEPLPALFTDHSFAESRHFRLSTSNLTPAPNFYGGFGPVTEDGYGVCYALRSTSCWFSVSSKTTCHLTDTKQMIRALRSSLNELHDLCLSLSSKL